MKARVPALTIVGDVCVDVVMGPLDGWPEVGSETMMDEHEIRPGGSAGNAALAMQYIGRPCTLVSQVGNCHFGRWLEGEFAGCEHHFGVTNAPTTMSVCLSHSCSERTIFTSRGHLEQMKPATALASLQTATHPGDCVLLAGVFLLPAYRREYASLLDSIGKAGYRIAIDTGWPSGGWNEETRAEVQAWLPRCAHLLVNEAEAQGLAGIPDTEQAAQAISQLMSADSCLVVKLGAGGAFAIGPGGPVRVNATVVEVRDSTGAGDTFNAGYLDACLRGKDLRDSLQAGCMLASRVIGHSPRGGIGHGELASMIS